MNGPQSALEVARLQQEIAHQLGLSMDKLVFDYERDGDKVRLDLFTINPRHDQSFLYHSVEGASKTDVLDAMVEYISKNYRQERSYTVQWSKVGENDLYTSYFRATNIYEVLEKFGHGRDISEYSIYSISMNPVA
jgi:hypothetical protein